MYRDVFGNFIFCQTCFGSPQASLCITDEIDLCYGEVDLCYNVFADPNLAIQPWQTCDEHAVFNLAVTPGRDIVLPQILGSKKPLAMATGGFCLCASTYLFPTDAKSHDGNR